MNKVVVGNFEGQANRNFPLDCEMFSSLQSNTAVVAIIGNIAGDKAILSGCVVEANRTHRSAGYVFLRTKDYPNGEVLFWEGGRNGDMYVKLEATSVIAQDYQYDNAYTSRSLAAGIGTERYMWKDFDTPKNIKEIEALIERQNEVINTLSSVPIGAIQIWGGHPAYTAIPDGYLTCRGQALNKN